MVDIDRASLDHAAHGPRKSGFLSSLGGPQFITAQFFTIFATILGVYLAGYVGFQRTLEYDQLVKARQQANLLTSMQAELKDNTDRLRAFVPKLEQTQEGKGVFGEWPRLHLFIWNASAENPVVFDTPPQTLAGMQTFYENIGVMLTNGPVQESFRRITSSNAYDRTQFTEKFDAQLKFAEEMLLPALRNAAAAANDTVRDYSD